MPDDKKIQPPALRLANLSRRLRRIAREYTGALQRNRNGAENWAELESWEAELEAQAVVFGSWFEFCNRGR